MSISTVEPIISYCYNTSSINVKQKIEFTKELSDILEGVKEK